MIRIKDIYNSPRNMEQRKDGTWVDSRPIRGPFIGRIKEAWMVLVGKAEALVYEDRI